MTHYQDRTIPDLFLLRWLLLMSATVGARGVGTALIDTLPLVSHRVTLPPS
jgi:hypothetical protein